MQKSNNESEPDEELQYLEDRINPFHLKQRLGIEEHREAWIIGQGSNFFSYRKLELDSRRHTRWSESAEPEKERAAQCSRDRP